MKRRKFFDFGGDIVGLIDRAIDIVTTFADGSLSEIGVEYQASKAADQVISELQREIEARDATIALLQSEVADLRAAQTELERVVHA